MTDITPETTTETVTGMCSECGCTRRARRRGFNYCRELRCDNCRRTTMHHRMHDPEGDHREQQNRERPLLQYDPCQDLADRWPGWNVGYVRLADADFAFMPSGKAIVICSKWANTIERRRWALALCVAHLDLGHVGTGEAMTRDEEEAAAVLAEDRLRNLTPTAVRWDDYGDLNGRTSRLTELLI